MKGQEKSAISLGYHLRLGYARGVKVKSENSWKVPLTEFFSGNLAQTAGSALSDGASILFHIEGETFYFARQNGKNILKTGSTSDPEFEFWIPGKTLRHLLDLARLPETGIATLGIAILEKILRGPVEERIRIKVWAGILKIWARGYFSVLKQGGPEVASYLAQWGFTNVSKIKDVLRKARG
jgi:hypothetical protein